jgi:hypothetical protein
MFPLTALVDVGMKVLANLCQTQNAKAKAQAELDLRCNIRRQIG